MTDQEVKENSEVIWNGGEGLVPDRETKNLNVWTPPNRIYNKTGNHSKKTKEPKND